jgi:hypothetical protein
MIENDAKKWEMKKKTHTHTHIQKHIGIIKMGDQSYVRDHISIVCTVV